jgi:hypothetical protein
MQTSASIVSTSFKYRTWGEGLAKATHEKLKARIIVEFTGLLSIQPTMPLLNRITLALSLS